MHVPNRRIHPAPLALVLMLALSMGARAQPTGPGPSFASPPFRSFAGVGKSTTIPGSASIHSVIGTAVPIGMGILIAIGSGGGDLSTALIVGGALVGPGTGYFTHGKVLRGLAGVGIRSGLALAFFGLATTVYDPDEILNVEAAVVGLTGAAAVTILSLFDIVNASRYVSERRVQPGMTVVGTPNGPAPGIGLSLRF